MNKYKNIQWGVTTPYNNRRKANLVEFFEEYNPNELPNELPNANPIGIGCNSGVPDILVGEIL